MKLSKIKANFILLVVAIIWGGSYTFTKQATNAQLSPSLINAFRGVIYAGLAFLFFHKAILSMQKKDFIVGIIAGFINFLGYQIQTIGIKYTTPSNSVFLTALYIVIIPFVVWLISHERPERKCYIAIVLSILGMFFLTNVVQYGLHIRVGDWLIILSAIFFALQIVYFSYALKNSNAWAVTFMLGVCQAVFGFVWAFLFDSGHLAAADWKACIAPILFLGIASSFGAQTLQLVGQKYTDPTIAGIVMMTESLFGSFFSVLFGFEALSAHLVEGGLLIIVAVLLMQLDFKKLSLRRKHQKAL